LIGGLCCTRLDFSLGQGAKRMIDNYRSEVMHTERVALHFCFVQKLGGDDDRSWPA
jgi:hypothetical protein